MRLGPTRDPRKTNKVLLAAGQRSLKTRVQELIPKCSWMRLLSVLQNFAQWIILSCIPIVVLEAGFDQSQEQHHPQRKNLQMRSQ